MIIYLKDHNFSFNIKNHKTVEQLFKNSDYILRKSRYSMATSFEFWSMGKRFKIYKYESESYKNKSLEKILRENIVEIFFIEKVVVRVGCKYFD